MDRVENARLAVGEVAKSTGNPLLKEDRPWEVRFDNVYPNVLYDAEAKLYKCWYSPFIVDDLTTGTPRNARVGVKYHSTPGREMGVCYATSADGIHWEKPALGVVSFQGSSENNLVVRAAHGAGIFKDVAESDPARRYKLFGGQQIPGQKRKFQVAFSADGIHWSQPLLCPEIGVEGDTHNNAIWAPDLKRYVGITRQWTAGQRLVMRTESPDFTHWTKALEVLRGDDVSQTYAMPIFRYEGVYLGLVMMINLKTDLVQCELTWSPDTVAWHRIDPGRALIPNSTPPGDYDAGCVYAGAVPVVVGDDVRIFYGASNGPHTNWRDGFLALATLRRERFAGYVAHPEDGMILTQPVRVTGDQLLVNVTGVSSDPAVDVFDEAAGDVAVDVLDEQGDPLAGFSGDDPVREPVTDQLRQLLRWKNAPSLAFLKGRVVRLRFHLRQAKLYSFQFR